MSFFRLDRDTIRIVEMNTPTQNNKIQKLEYEYKTRESKDSYGNTFAYI